MSGYEQSANLSFYYAVVYAGEQRARPTFKPRTKMCEERFLCFPGCFAYCKSGTKALFRTPDQVASHAHAPVRLFHKHCTVCRQQSGTQSPPPLCFAKLCTCVLSDEFAWKPGLLVFHGIPPKICSYSYSLWITGCCARTARMLREAVPMQAVIAAARRA